MANKALKAARKAYSKNKDTKYKWENGKKTEKKRPKREKEKPVASSYGQVEKKTQTVGSQGEKNRKNASVKKAASSVKNSLTPSKSGGVTPVSSHYGNVTNKAKDRTFTDKKWTVSDVASKVKKTANVHSGANNKDDKKKPTTVSSHFGQVADKTQELGKKHSKKVGYDDSDVKDYIGENGTAKGTEAGKAFNRHKTADDALKKEGEKKVTTTKNASLLYGIDAAIQKAGYMSKQPAEAAKFYDEEEKKAQKEGMTYGDKKEFIRKWVSDKSNEEVLNAIDEYKNQKIKDSSYTYTKAPTSTGEFFIRENASKYANNQTKTETNQPVYQTDKDGNIKYDKNGKPKVKKDKNGNVVYQKIDSNQGNNILDYYGGGFDENGRLKNQNASTKVGNQTAGWIHDAPVAAGVMQGLSYSDITRGLGNYSNAAAKDLENTKNSGAFNVGYMIGQGGQFLLGGTNKMTDALVKGVAKSGATRSALNVGLRKGAADMMFEAPMNTLDALKMSTDANGNFDKKAFIKYMALNTGLSGGMGGVIGGVGAKMTKSDVRKFAELSEKLNKNIELTPDELKQYDKIQKKLDSSLQGNDRVKEDYINAGKADAVLSKADNKEYMSLLGKEQTGNLTQQERVRLSSYENVVRRNYDEAQNNYAKVLSDAAGGEKVNINDVKEATEFFERSGNAAKATEAETILENTTKERQLEIIKKTNPKDDSLGDHTWVESVDDIKTFDEVVTGEDFTPDFTAKQAQEALESGEITVYSSKPIEDGAFVTPSKMEAQNYAGSGKVFEQRLKTDEIAWIDEGQGQVAKVGDEPQTKSYEDVFESGTIIREDVEEYLAKTHREVSHYDERTLKNTTDATEEMLRVGDSVSNNKGTDGLPFKAEKGTNNTGVVADRFSRQFITQGYVDFRGTKVRGVDDLAEAMQVYRDPRFETFRVVFMRGKKIVAVDGVSSKMPNFTTIKVGEQTDEEFVAAFRDRMKNLNANGYYLVHNHPSGKPIASIDDKMQTRAFKRHLKGYKGHIILDHNSYGVVEKTGKSRVVERQGDVGEDLLRKPSIDHPLLGEEITNTEQAVKVLKQMEDGEKITTLVYTDNYGTINGIENISVDLSRNAESFSGFIRNRARHFGGARVIMGTKDAKTVELAKEYIRNGTLTDCVHYTDAPYSLHSRGHKTEKGMVFGKNEDEYFGKRVKESANEYGTNNKPPQGGSFNAEKPKRVFYHAGDLGKSEWHHQQAGSKRHTGHYGTGTYFTSDPEILKREGYGSRPLKEVDATDYNLYRPDDYDTGIRVHDNLRTINRSSSDLSAFIRKAGTTDEEISAMRQTVEDAGEYSAENLESLNEVAEKVLSKGDIEELKRVADEAVEQRKATAGGEYRDAAEQEFERFKKQMENEYGLDVPESERARYIDDYIESRNELEMRSPEQEYYYELSDRLTKELDGNTQYGKSSFLDDVASTRKAVSQLAEDLDKTEEEVNKAIEKAADTIKGYGEKAKEDSASTIIMKELGYDGVDVSGIKGLDNTEYGSVIYDLKQAEKSKPKTKTPTETKPKPEETKSEPQTTTAEAKEPKKTEAQKLSDNKYASDELKSSVKEIEAAGIYKEEVEKSAKKYNDLDKKIAGLQNRINNAKKKEYPTEAEKTAHIAELEDELRTLRNRQNNVAGEIEQMGKMKAVDNSKTAKEQIRELHGDRSVNKELKNADNLKNEDSWIKDKWNSVRRLWEDSLIDVENVAKKTGGELREQMLTAANRVRNSMNVANNWITHTRKSFDNKVGGKALDDIFTKELIQNEAKYNDFQEYLIMKHVPARHAKGTDIYADISPELAAKRVKELEQEYGDIVEVNGKKMTEIEAWANDVYDYLKDLQQYRVDSGLLSKEAADEFAKDYPFYVPTNRVNDETVDFFTGGTSNGIRTAKGGESEVLDMYSQLYTATNKTIHAAEENQMLNLYFKAKGVTDEQIKQYSLNDLEHATINATVNKKTGAAKVSFFIDGKPVEFPCSHQLALGLRELDGLEFERLMKAAKVATLYGKPFKALITDWNLVFGVRNGMRDLQQAVVNSKDTKYFGSSMGAAAHAIADNNSPYRKAYASMGGEQAQLVSYDAVAERMGLEKGRVDKIHEKVDEWVDASVNVKGKDVNTNPIHYIEGINGAIEMMPRMCEFIGTLRKNADAVLKKQGSSVKKLRKEIVAEVEALEKSGKVGASEVGAEVENRLAERILEIAGKDGLDSAMRNANDITLNFGRSGVLGKALNMGFVPYLNPSIQGLSKLARLFTEAGGEGGWKALASIGMKLGTFTIAPAVWNELALRNNEDFQNINTRDKDNNFFIALGDGKFLKIPKPRENAVLAEPVEYGLRYFLDKTEYDYFDMGKLKNGGSLWEKIPLTDEGKQSFRTALDNIGVINPATSNMFSPLWQTFHNKTWYGGSIESAYEVANKKSQDRYDTGTSGVAIWLGDTAGAKFLNLSPKKIDNIMDSYLGMIYDLGISQTTEEAKTRGNYVVRTMASQFIKDSVFSNKLSTKAWDKIDGMSEEKAQSYKSKYMYDTYKYDDAMDMITADKNMTVQEKMAAKRELQKQKNKINRAAIDGAENESNPLVDIAKHLGAHKTLNNFLPKSGDDKYDTWTDYYKNFKKTKGFKGMNPKQKEKEAQKFLDVYTLGVKGQSKVGGDFHDSPSWSMTGVAAAQRYKQGKLSQKDAKTIMESCGVYESQTASYFKYADHGGNVSRYAVTKKNNNKAEDLAESMGVTTSGDGSIWKNKYSKEKGIKGGVLSMSLATGKADFKDRAYYISNSGDANMLIKMNAARGYAEKYGHTTKQLIKLGKKADTDGNTYLSNEEIESACNTIKGGKATSEEKAMGWVLLGGNPNKNPFGEIGNYAHDGDTGITMDDDGKSGGHGRRGRGRRGRGGGGGGSKKGTMPKTESGAIKGKITDPFAGSNGAKASNLNDAYRKKVRKLRKESR